MTILKAVGWDHERCMGPMRAAAEVYERETGVIVTWFIRSGESFAETPLDALTESYDVIAFDHPFVGSVATTKALNPIDELLPAGVLSDLAADAVGKSHDSYIWEDHQWGLAVDAACMVSVIRPDLLGDDVPRTWDEALSLARSRHGHVTTSLSSHDAICSLLTICANTGQPIEPSADRFADPEVALPALAWLLAYAKHCHPSAWSGFVVNPMTESNEIAYGLLQWGYTNYSRPTFQGPRLRFTNIPSGGLGPIGATLGGVGLGVSARSSSPRAAADFVAWVAAAGTQRDIVFPHGGQPSSRSVWSDRSLDDAAGGFFSATRKSMDNASLRPRAGWWPEMQRDGGATLARGLRHGSKPAELLADLERVYRQAIIGHAIGST